MNQFSIDSKDNEPGFIRRHAVGFSIAAIMLIGAGAFAWHTLTSHEYVVKSEPKPPRFPNIPVPPPVAPTPPPVKKEKEIVEAKETMTIPAGPVTPPVDTTPAPPAAPPSTAISGPGDSDLAPSGDGSGPRIIGGQGGDIHWQWNVYAGDAKRTIEAMLRSNEHTKKAAFEIQVCIWPDKNGRITRATLQKSTGSASVDKAITDEVLTGLQLQQNPPADMPRPIIMRLIAKRTD